MTKNLRYFLFPFPLLVPCCRFAWGPCLWVPLCLGMEYGSCCFAWGKSAAAAASLLDGARTLRPEGSASAAALFRDSCSHCCFAQGKSRGRCRFARERSSDAFTLLRDGVQPVPLPLDWGGCCIAGGPSAAAAALLGDGAWLLLLCSGTEPRPLLLPSALKTGPPSALKTGPRVRPPPLSGQIAGCCRFPWGRRCA